MAHDPLDRFAMLRRPDAAFDLLEADVLAEKASSLGHHGRLVEQAMAALRAYDASPGGDPEERLVLVRKAARVVWAFLVQRELCGLRDQKQIIKDYGIPAEVIVRLGIVERR
jgi:hypothetical protein